MSRLSSRLREHLEQSDRAAIADWTYTRLNDVSARIAGALLDCPKDQPVALLMDHGPELIAAIVAVVRTGRCYLVPSPGRLQLSDLQPGAWIADAAHLPLAKKLGVPFLSFEKSQKLPPDFAFAETDESTALAIFYTSGSTGQPTPYVYTHGGTWQTVGNHAASLALTPDDRLSLLSPTSAAASVSGLFGALLHGACVLPHSPSAGLAEWLDAQKPSVLHLVPSLFRRFAATLPAEKSFDSVRAIKFGGEPLFSSDVPFVTRHFPRCRLVINGLGATEANGNICHFPFDPQTFSSATGNVPIGRALTGFHMRVAVESGEDAAPGEVGEILVRSDFPPPRRWGSAAETPLWRSTGDLGQRDSDGLFHHLGRRDGQFKSHGLWITPSLVEGALQAHAAVREAGCIPLLVESGEPLLAAFLVWRETAASDAELRSHLASRIPPHLMPRRFWTLPAFPVLANGKLDRVQLARIGAERLRQETLAPPDSTDPLIVQLTRIWQAALRLERIGLDDDFFDLGGDSLAAAAIFTEVERSLRRHLPVSILLKAPTIQRLANHLRSGGWTKSELRLIPLQLEGNGPPIFCVPGAGTEALALRFLAAHLGNGQPFFAFQPQGLDGREPYLRTVEDMARRYVADLCERCPAGPFVLCGTSFGGVVALEMAQQLRALGRVPASLILIDARGGTYPRLRKFLPIRLWPRWLLRPFLPEFQEDQPLSLGLLGEGIANWWKRKIVWLDIIFHFKKLPRPNELRFIYLRESCRVARRKYVARPWPGKIHLLRAAQQPSDNFYESDPYLGWQGLAENGLEVAEVPGDHVTHMREPHVAVVAEKLREILG
ncbi:MAG: AMP-binding protein [Chthoniobacterales bacterium]